MVAPRRRLAPKSRISTTVNRPPIIVEFGDVVVRVGIAGDASVRQILALPPSPPASTSSAPFFYRYLSPLLENVFQSILQKPNDRKVVVLTSMYPPKAWKEALLRCAHDSGVASVAYCSHVECVPALFPLLQDVLVVHLSSTQSSSMVHAEGQSLPYTFQSVPLITADDDALYNPYNPQSIIFSILKTLEACPMLVRKQVIQNMVVVGDIVVQQPFLPVLLARQLSSLLQSQSDARFDQPTEGPSRPIGLSYVPVDLTALKPLASFVGLLSTAPYRSDLAAWVGCSVWASLWYDTVNADKVFRWRTPSVPTCEVAEDSPTM